jgi:hypothetical protein
MAKTRAVALTGFAPLIPRLLHDANRPDLPAPVRVWLEDQLRALATGRRLPGGHRLGGALPDNDEVTWIDDTGRVQRCRWPPVGFAIQSALYDLETLVSEGQATVFRCLQCGRWWWARDARRTVCSPACRTARNEQTRDKAGRNAADRARRAREAERRRVRRARAVAAAIDRRVAEARRTRVQSK